MLNKQILWPHFNIDIIQPVELTYVIGLHKIIIDGKQHVKWYMKI